VPATVTLRLVTEGRLIESVDRARVPADHKIVILPPRSPGRAEVSQKDDAHRGSANRVVELFAGVGGFRLALQESGWQTIWANQWEPSTKTQHAADCYRSHFDDGTLVNEDINLVLDEVPGHDLLVGGFPCQDYSVAKTLSQAAGIEGKKGVLWWSIRQILEDKRPRFVFLENVDRLLKSPATQRGRDFAIILACLSDLGYLVEWRVVNAADYGFPQRRRRVFIVAEHLGEHEPSWGSPIQWLYERGVLARSLEVWPFDDLDMRFEMPDLELKGHLSRISAKFGLGNKVTPFQNAGVMWSRKVWTQRVVPNFDGKRQALGEQLVSDDDVPESFFIPENQIPQWKYLKGAKREARRAANGHEYFYTEGAVAFPEPLDQPSRTILTGEGGSTPSRFKHVIRAADGRLRRLTPIELERLNGFDDDWTDTGMPDGRRAFMMGNALVVGLVARVALSIGSES
jgi:DNA (cytosine-5)-methyltransferase 1